MEMYKSRKGDVGSRSYWETELDLFWRIFEINTDLCTKARLPKRPTDAWDRYVAILGLELI